MYFDHFVFLSQLFTATHTSLSTQLHYALSFKTITEVQKRKKIKSNKQKTDKTRKVPKQNEKFTKKKTHHGDHFVLATISVSAAFLPSRMLIYPVTLHDRKLVFLCQWFSVADSVLAGMRSNVHFPFSVLWLCLCGSCASASLCEFISPVVSGRYNFIGVIYHLWLFQSFHPLIVHSLALRGVVGGKHAFNTACFKFSLSVYIIQLWVSVLFIPIYCKKFLWEGWSMHWAIGMPVCHDGSFYFYFV